MTMQPAKKRGVVVLAVLALVAAWAAISHATGAPPFKKPKGTIEAAELCPSLGDRDEAAGILNRILPYAPAYSVPAEDNRPRADAGDTTYSTLCDVHGDGRLVVVRSEMEPGENREQWQERVLGNTVGGGAEPFGAGRWAFTSTNRKAAAVFSSCLTEGDHGVTTYVKLTRPAPADRLDDLRRLAVLAAEQAHKAAGCTLAADAPRP
ncbi:hypothetical protein ACH4OX_27675 [Streptomyces roseolus]|uniref:hypothetical protein n=1 Tax=Streptomyces roseolus TaxID=67358 RepID=UPI0037A6BB81